MTAVLITNAKIFDGENEALTDGMNVLVEGNKISKIAKSISTPKGATVIDAGGCSSRESQVTSVPLPLPPSSVW